MDEYWFTAQGIWRCVGDQFADVNVVAQVGLWYGQAYVMDKEHMCISFMAV